MSNPDYPDPCDYCPLMYLANKPVDCRKDCKALKEATKQWAKEQKEKPKDKNVG